MKRFFNSLLFILFLASACQKEDLTFSDSTAQIIGLVETGVGRNDGSNADKFPYRIYFDVTATLSDIADVQEWGVYFVDSDTNEPLEFAFDEINHKVTERYHLNTIPDLLHKGEETSYIEASRRMGLYLKKNGKKGKLDTYYGDLKSYTVRYDFPSTPSVEYSNPRIVSSEEVEVDGVTKHRTKYTYYLTVKGAFWIESLKNRLNSGWGWDEISNYSLSEGTHSKSATMTYSPGNVNFSQWTMIHCYDSDKDIESKNWLNVSGDPSISKIEVSDFERNI